MSWNGSGTYSRGYPSWANDASQGLPISATKFDLEDSDFQAGIQNCLTIDGQNPPNAALSWGSPAVSSGVVLTLNCVSGQDGLQVLGTASIKAGATIGATSAGGGGGGVLQVLANSTANPAKILINNGTSGTGAGAFSLLDIYNGSHYLVCGIASTGFSGAWPGSTGAPSGESAGIYTVGSVPLWFGTNLTQGMLLNSTGLLVNGQFSCNGSALASQPTGYGTPTGGSRQASFAAGSITLANLAAAVAQLIIDLKGYGLLGA